MHHAIFIYLVYFYLDGAYLASSNKLIFAFTLHEYILISNWNNQNNQNNHLANIKDHLNQN